MARTYNRDSRGRFTSGGGSGSGGSRGPVKVGRAGPRGGKVGTRAEQRRAQQAQQQRTQQFSSKKTVSAAQQAYKQASRTARAGKPRNAIRTFTRPATTAARQTTARSVIVPGPRATQAGGQIDKQAGRAAWRAKRREQVEQTRWRARTEARAMADRLRGGFDAQMARIVLNNFGSTLGAQQIKRRARRAAQLAAKGSKVAARALQMYDQQLAGMRPGKAPKKASNSIRPGPRNANPEKKPKRKRKPKPKA